MPLQTAFLPFLPLIAHAGASEYPIMRSILAANGRLPAEPQTGPAGPVGLTPTDSIKCNWKRDAALGAR